ncbi:hypothetical protein LEP1GSC052_3500 [Leptospira kmetyi serovar Malaysia str. Bejo-Iso9]|nr:hypothetical protein LEP1GSC052_3500 [Leptospira kmetyi serovar Malaysia str. Bejo-Iso9]
MPVFSTILPIFFMENRREPIHTLAFNNLVRISSLRRASYRSIRFFFTEIKTKVKSK